MTDFERQIKTLDTGLFVVDSQTSAEDRVSLLRLQNAVRNIHTNYTYLEVGSHLGGSLMPHLLDPRCANAVSIDVRPQFQPDERGRIFEYETNTTARMIATLLPHLTIEERMKLTTHEVDACRLQPSTIAAPPHLILIDAEHTNRAAFRDFLSVLKLAHNDAIIAFHDAHILVDAMCNIKSFCVFVGTPFEAVFLSDSVFAVGLNRMASIMRECLQPYALEEAPFIASSKNWLYHQIQASLQKSAADGGRLTHS